MGSDGEPSQSRLCTWVDVEPRTGMTVALARRSQLSAAVPLPLPLSPPAPPPGGGSSSSSRSSSAPAPPLLLPGGATLLPLLWHDRRGEVTPAAADAFARRVTRLEDAATRVATIGLAVCGVAVALAAGCWLWGCRLRKHARLERLEEGAGRRMAGALAAAALRSVSGLRLDDDGREGGGEGAAAAEGGGDGEGEAGDDGDSPQQQAEWVLRPLLAGDGRWRTGGEGRPASATGPLASTPPAAPPAPPPVSAWAGSGGRGVGWAALASSADDGEGGGWPGASLAELEGGGGGNDEWGPEQAAAAAAPLYWPPPRAAPGVDKGDAAVAAAWLLDAAPPSPRDADRGRPPLLLQSLRRGGAGIQ